MTPCPFCGSLEIAIHQEKEVRGQVTGILAYAECQFCEARSPWGWFNIKFYTIATIEESIWKDWNTRIESVSGPTYNLGGICQ